MSVQQRGAGALVVVVVACAAAACSSPPLTPERAPTARSTSTAPLLAGPPQISPLPPLVDVRLEDVPAGERPGIAYVRQNVVVSPNGRRTVLERPPVPPRPELEDTTGLAYGTLLRIPAGWVGVTDDGMQPVTTLHGPDGTFRRYLWRGSEGRVHASPRGRGFSLDARNGVRLLDGRMDGQGVTLLRRLPSQVAVMRSSAGFVSAKAVAVNVRSMGRLRPLRVLLVSPDSPMTTIPGLRRVAATSPSSHRVTGTTSPKFGAKADTVYTSDGTPLLHAPGFELISFSPDGSVVVGTPHAFNGRRFILVQVATGKVMAQVRVAPSGLAWEDGRHLLAVVASRRGEADLDFHVLRVSMSGEVEVALQTRLPLSNNSHLNLIDNPG